MESHDSGIDEALATFIDALSKLDRERLEACFAEGASVFLPWGGPRRDGMWNERFAEMAAARPGPYFTIEPRDVRVEMLGGIALVTFHLLQPDSLGRRTLLLRRTGDAWKILHLHASNLPL
jgi:ketosteroid isomerase-like protein